MAINLVASSATRKAFSAKSTHSISKCQRIPGRRWSQLLSIESTFFFVHYLSLAWCYKKSVHRERRALVFQMPAHSAPQMTAASLESAFSQANNAGLANISCLRDATRKVFGAKSTHSTSKCRCTPQLIGRSLSLESAFTQAIDGRLRLVKSFQQGLRVPRQRWPQPLSTQPSRRRLKQTWSIYPGCVMLQEKP